MLVLKVSVQQINLDLKDLKGRSRRRRRREGGIKAIFRCVLVPLYLSKIARMTGIT